MGAAGQRTPEDTDAIDAGWDEPAAADNLEHAEPNGNWAPAETLRPPPSGAPPSLAPLSGVQRSSPGFDPQEAGTAAAPPHAVERLLDAEDADGRDSLPTLPELDPLRFDRDV
jgi:hypothetical protein